MQRLDPVQRTEIDQNPPFPSLPKRNFFVFERDKVWRGNEKSESELLFCPFWRTITGSILAVLYPSEPGFRGPRCK